MHLGVVTHCISDVLDLGTNLPNVLLLLTSVYYGKQCVRQTLSRDWHAPEPCAVHHQPDEDQGDEH